MVECSLCIREVRGSMPGISSNGNNYLQIIPILCERIEKFHNCWLREKKFREIWKPWDVGQTVERPLTKPEVRGAIPRIFKVKDIKFLINFLQKTTEYWNLIQEIPSQKIYNLLFADWNKSFLDSSKLWGCTSNGRALALHAIGTGIDVPHLQNKSNSPNSKHYLQIIYCILKFLTSRFSANEKKTS